MCADYYNWFKYVTGNLVGVGLTDVGPASGHYVTELIDLLIAVWSLALTGMRADLSHACRVRAFTLHCHFA